MKINKKWFVFLLVILLIVFASGGALLAQTGGNYALTWHTIDGGGGTVTGGDYTLSGTAGQPDAAVVIGGDYTLSSGFWHGDSNDVGDSFIYLPIIIK